MVCFNDKQESCYATPGRYVCFVSAHKGMEKTREDRPGKAWVSRAGSAKTHAKLQKLHHNFI